MRPIILLTICFGVAACSPKPDTHHSSHAPQDQNLESDIKSEVRTLPLPASSDESKFASSSPHLPMPATLSDQVSAKPRKNELDEFASERAASTASAIAPSRIAPSRIAPSRIVPSQNELSKNELSRKIVQTDSRHPSPTSTHQEHYQTLTDNAIQLVQQAPVSTFSIDVDTGAYSNVRRMLMAGSPVIKDAVRLEEMINYFNYDYPHPNTENQPFALYTELAPAPWDEQHLLLHIGVQGYNLDNEKLPSANLVFLIDVSGSMNTANKLPLLKNALKLLVNNMSDHDRISIVVYAGAAGLVLPPTAISDTNKILHAIDHLTAGGSTNGGQGIKLAYQQAEAAFIKGGINRVILASDGDFNVGISDIDQLKDFIAKKRRANIQLTTLGFGSGNYNDAMMEQLADVGDGHYAYIDNLNEARKVLVEEKASTLKTIAHDVKIQIEFNPALVHEYRLIGYENRMLRREDFNNDRVDAGDIGAGHSVTALYQIKLADQGRSMIDPLRYGKKTIIKNDSNELAFIKLRYKLPGEDNSQLIHQAIAQEAILTTEQSSERFRFAASVSAFGQLLRGGQYLADFDWDNTLTLAQLAKGNDLFGYRSEFINLIKLAKAFEPTLTKR